MSIQQVRFQFRINDKVHVPAFLRTVAAVLIALSFSASAASSQIASITDVGLQSGFQDTVLGHFKTGRAGIGADFDLDGYIDYYVGNPGDESFVFRNTESPRGGRFFQVQQVLLTDSLAWGGVAFDYDNDGDYDLFIACGGNEGIGYNFLFRNNWIPTGTLNFTDVTEIAGVAGPVPAPPSMLGEARREIPMSDDDCGMMPEEYKPVLTFEQLAPRSPSFKPVRTSSANAVVADYDQDGDEDLFVNGNIQTESDPRYPELIGRNTLWRNNNDGTFTDVTYQSGLGASLRPTRHSTFLDYDNDGDADLYENNFGDINILWRNNGDGTFTDRTTEASGPGEDLHFPWKSFVSGSADFDNNGWDDIMAFQRGSDDGNHGSPYENGHLLFLNMNGVFYNIASSTIINDHFVGDGGVMGCTVGDISGDGLPDIYIGNGAPAQGEVDQLYVSVPGTRTPSFVDNTSLIDFPATIPPGLPVPPYPYRTHGTSITDIDADGYPELAVVNGGTARSNNAEPNRLFKIRTVAPYNWFKVRPVGDGITIAKDAIGTKVKLEGVTAAGEPWVQYRTLFAGTAFNAQAGFTLSFAIENGASITGMEIRWPDGQRSAVNADLAVNTSMVVTATSSGAAALKTTDEFPAEVVPGQFALYQNYPNPFNPSTTIDYTLPEESPVSLKIFDVLGREVATLVDGVQTAGYQSVSWNGTDSFGAQVSSGIYIYRLKAGEFNAVQKMMLAK